MLAHEVFAWLKSEIKFYFWLKRDKRQMNIK